MAAAAAIAGHLVDVRDMTKNLVDLQISTGKQVLVFRSSSSTDTSGCFAMLAGAL